MRSGASVLAALVLLISTPAVTQAGEPSIAYMVSGTQRYIEVMDDTGGNVMRVYKPPKFSPYGLSPSWSQDGTELVFTDHGWFCQIPVSEPETVFPEGCDEYSVAGQLNHPVDGIIAYSGRLSYPVWSPETDEIAVVTGDPETISVFTNGHYFGQSSDPQGDPLEVIYEPPAGFTLNSDIAWSPDGSMIAVLELHGSETAPPDLIIIDRDFKVVLRRIAGVDGRGLDWSRSGAQILFSGSAGEDNMIYTISVDAETGDEALALVQADTASWSPDIDDSRVVFREYPGKLKIFNLGTGEITSLGRGNSPDWSRVLPQPQCSVDPDCVAGEICCAGSCKIPLCWIDSDCSDGDICTDDFCLGGCSGCENIFDEANDPICSAPACLPKGDPCDPLVPCCSGRCHPVNGTCK